MAAFAGIVTLVLAIAAAAKISSFQRACPIDPIAVDLGPLPKAEGFWSSEFNLQKLEKIVVGQMPEDVAFDSQGRAYTGLADGWIKRIGVDGTVENHTYTGGHVLGLALGPGEEIYYADAHQGLFKISNDGVIHLLSNEADGTEVNLADGVVVSKDGTVYFTDATTNFKFENYVLDLIEGRPSGRVLKYNPSTSTTSVLIKNMSFPNGVALSENEDFLLISETFRARVMRYWLKGEKEGTLETFVDGLPAYPDNVRLSESDGNFYIGLVGKRTRITDWTLSTPNTLLRCLFVNPHVRNLLSEMQRAVVIVVSPEGKLVNKYEDSSGKMISTVTGGNKVGDSVYFSNLGSNFLGRLQL